MKPCRVPLFRQRMAVALSLCLVLTIPGTGAWAAVVTSARAPMGVRLAGVSLPNLSLKNNFAALTIPPLLNDLTQSVPEVPAVKMINLLLEKGIDLTGSQPEWKTRQKIDAMMGTVSPDSPVRHSLGVLAASLPTHSGGAVQTDKFSSYYDHGNPPTSADISPVTESLPFRFWNTLAKVPLLPKSMKEKFAQRAEEKIERRAGELFGAADPAAYELTADQVRWTPDIEKLSLSPLPEPARGNPVIGQDRGLEAIRFGLQMKDNYHHLFLAGPGNSGRKTALRHELAEIASKQPSSPDRLIISNLLTDGNIALIPVPAGTAPKIKKGIEAVIAQAKQALPGFLRSPEALAHKQSIEDDFYRQAESRLQEAQVKLDRDQQPIGRLTVRLQIARTDHGPVVEILPALDGVTLTPKLQKERLRAQQASLRVAKEELEQFRQDAQALAQPYVNELKEALAPLTSTLQEQILGADVERAMQLFQELSAPIQQLVSGGKLGSHDDEAHQTWMRNHKERLNALEAKVKENRIGRFGLALAVMSRPEGQEAAIVLTLDGKPYATLRAEIISPEATARLQSGAMSQEEQRELKQAILAARPIAKSLMREYAAMTKELKKEHRNIHKAEQESLSPEQRSAVGYLDSFLRAAAYSHRSFLPGQGPRSKSHPVDPSESFKVEVLSSSDQPGAPVVDATQRPTYEELFGQLILKDEKEEGPDYATIQGGLLHQAENGYIYLDALHVLRTPNMYHDLMEAVETGQVRISESAGGLGKLLKGKRSIRLPWKGKVILVGSSQILEVLKHYDPAFSKHFQATAQFDSRMDINDKTTEGVKSFLSRMLSSGEFSSPDNPIASIDAGAVAATLEYAARMADSNERITARLGALLTPLREAAFWAANAGRQEITRRDVEQAIDAKLKREGLFRDRMQEMYAKDIFHIQIEGEVVGQVNALTVYGDDFGLPTRGTVVMYPANGTPGVEDSDDIIGWAGESFKAGVQNVANFILSIFAVDNDGDYQAFPARLSTKKEQLYGGIDGDSSTSTKMYASVSAIARVPIKQSRSITGSADQFGNVQPIGGANEKIEGFYDVVTWQLKLQGKELDGSHGVVIPASNVKDLQLRPDVVQAIKDGKFHVWGVRHVGQGLEILTGMTYKKLLYLGNKVLAAMRKAVE